MIPTLKYPRLDYLGLLILLYFLFSSIRSRPFSTFQPIFFAIPGWVRSGSVLWPEMDSLHNLFLFNQLMNQNQSNQSFHRPRGPPARPTMPPVQCRNFLMGSSRGMLVSMRSGIMESWYLRQVKFWSTQNEVKTQWLLWMFIGMKHLSRESKSFLARLTILSGFRQFPDLADLTTKE